MKLNLKKWIENMMRCSFLWRGVARGSLNDYRATGIYYVNSETTSGKPIADASNMWGYMFVVGFSSAMTVQALWATGDSFYIRNYSGDPGAWQKWICLTRSNNTVLWTGVAYMSEVQTITLSEPISRQGSGIVLAWSSYVNGTANNYDWAYTFIPKWHVTPNSGQVGNGIHCTLASSTSGKKMATKYVYVTDTTIRGNTYNDEAATTIANGFVAHPGYWVLRAVIGV